MTFKELSKIYWFAAATTIVIWATVGWKMGISSLFTVIVLTILETTFSADNAVVNSKVLTTLSPKWQKIFMTLGVFIAVFIVRFALPILMVKLSAGISVHQVLDLALHHPHEYAHQLSKAEPAINAFGGAFLIMIALSYFIDYHKKTHWLPFLEKYLGKLGRFDNVTVFIMLLASLALYATVDPSHHAVVFMATIVAMTLHIGLELLDAIIGKAEDQTSVKHKVGWAAFAAFAYLEILDASFSLDGVIGAFALTSSVILIIAGLGAGAVWVRAMTVHLVKSQALSKYIYLEHGAHWAIAFLGGVMLLKLYHITLPEWFVGSLGLVFIGLAIVWSKRQADRRQPVIIHE
ncbi:MAG: DUF475 domain-containing protein [Candidatus Saccharibacteria bacterium]